MWPLMCAASHPPCSHSIPLKKHILPFGTGCLFCRARKGVISVNECVAKKQTNILIEIDPPCWKQDLSFVFFCFAETPAVSNYAQTLSCSMPRKIHTSHAKKSRWALQNSLFDWIEGSSHAAKAHKACSSLCKFYDQCSKFNIHISTISHAKRVIRAYVYV